MIGGFGRGIKNCPYFGGSTAVFKKQHVLAYSRFLLYADAVSERLAGHAPDLNILSSLLEIEVACYS